LQPYFPRVWNFQSWMLAFELALDSRDPAERWIWVTEAMDLLRGPALRANPLSAEIHRQLSYLFWFKIGEFQDEAALYYQGRLCDRWRRILGDPPDGDIGRYGEVLRQIASAPADLAQLPAEIVSDAELVSLIERSWADPGSSGTVDSPAIIEHLAATDLAPSVWGVIKAFLQRRIVERDMNMSPDLLLEISEEVGAVDWRTPAAQGLYWAIQGSLRQADGHLAVSLLPEKLDEVLIETNVRICLQQLVARGRVLLDENGDLITILPQPALLPMYERALVLLTRGEGIPEEFLPRVVQIISGAVVDSWLQGEELLARRLLLRHDQLSGKSDRPENQDLLLTITDLVSTTLDEGEPIFTLAILIRTQALVASGGGGTAMQAERGLRLAQKLEEDLTPLQRIEIRQASLVNALRSPRARAPLLVKRKIWGALSELDRETVDETTRSLLSIEAKRGGSEPEQLFPGISTR
ncbi:MAG: hypothetical protein AAEJ04_03765, partial [Planctomycetota bacterium]